jgi:hypothetical protein
MAILTESAAINDPTRNTTFAIRRIGFRPKMSEILPQMGVVAAAARRYAEPIHVYPAALWKCSDIVGRAVVMMVYNKLEKCPDPVICAACGYLLYLQYPTLREMSPSVHN